MKYIDARTQDLLNQSVMKFLKLTEYNMINIFKTIYYCTKKEPCEWVEDFLADHIIDETLEYIQMFHLTRRLNDTDLRANNNLQQLLLGKSPLSEFLKKYNVTFEKGKGHIDMLYKGKVQLLDNEYKYPDGNVYYVKSRLGYNDIQDFCVNGFAFRSYLEDNNYFTLLSRCPELVGQIEELLGIKGMSFDYYYNSKYYCIEYLIPLSEVIFDINNPPQTERDKTMELLKQSLLRLYNDWAGNSFLCDENLILRLSDDAMIKPEWFINAEEILK